MIQDIEDPALAKARGKLSHVARGLAEMFGGDVAAASLAGALVGLVEQEHGRERAIEWLRELANELERDDAEPVWHDHAH